MGKIGRIGILVLAFGLVLWMAERKPVAATEQTVETGVLDAIQMGL